MLIKETKRMEKGLYKDLYSALDFFMLRIPLLSIDDIGILSDSNHTYERYMETLINLSKDPIIREAILVGSPSLFWALPNLSNSNDTRKRDQAIKGFVRYLLRMTTRSTPYGLFAGVGHGLFKQDTKLVLGSNHKKRTRPDMEWLLALVKNIEADENILKQLKVTSSSSVYKHGNRMKLPYTMNKKNSNSGTSIAYTNMVRFVLEISKNPIICSELLEEIKRINVGVPEEIIIKFIRNLIEQDYLITELKPTLTQADTFNYVMRKLENISGIAVEKIRQSLQYIETLIIEYDKTPLGEGEEIYLKLIGYMKNLVEVKTPLQVDLHIGEEIVTFSGKIKDDLEESAAILFSTSNSNGESQYFYEYKHIFMERYGEDREVPLLELVDKDMGIGYPTIKQKPLNQKNEHVRYRENYLLQLLNEAMFNHKLEVVLSDTDIQALKNDRISAENAPVSIELYFTIACKSKIDFEKGNYVIVPSANPGSDGAGKSFGRFSDILGTRCLESLKNIEEYEERAINDSNIVFAELVCNTTRERLANLCSINSIRKYEIVIGTNSEKKDEFLIDLKDLVVGIDDGTFYIKSKKLNKKIIPVTGHMLNKQSYHPIYRFLREIGLQKHADFLTFDWGDLNKYPILPRLIYKNIILSPARWQINKETRMLQKVKSKEEWIERFQEVREQWLMPQYVYIGNFDNRILLNLDNRFHLDEIYRDFIKLKKNESINLVELGYSLEELWVKSFNGLHFMEVVVPFIRNHDFLPNVSQEDKVNVMNTQVFAEYMGDLNCNRTFFPGSEWLYLKIYGISERQEELLGKELRSLCELLYEKEYVDEHFFIRYKDPDPHIRLRFRGDSAVLTNKILPIINEWSLELYSKGLLTSFNVDTYEREIERYGGEKTIHLAEKVFCLDSKLVSEMIYLKRFLKKRISYEQIGVLNIIDILKNFGFTLEEGLNLLDKRVNFKDYVTEFRNERKNYMEIAKKVQEQNIKNIHDLNDIEQLIAERGKALKEYSNRVEDVIKGDELNNIKEKIVASLIHMHINRLIGVEREHEYKLMCIARHSLHALKKYKEYQM
ncbi:hypothetical protein CN354_05945 [Bacillus cereus]|nr:hypothetical protein CN354_05945 [Bacillus cereus]